MNAPGGAPRAPRAWSRKEKSINKDKIEQQKKQYKSKKKKSQNLVRLEKKCSFKVKTR
jgi:hypothetical protein